MQAPSRSGEDPDAGGVRQVRRALDRPQWVGTPRAVTRPVGFASRITSRLRTRQIRNAAIPTAAPRTR